MNWRTSGNATVIADVPTDLAGNEIVTIRTPEENRAYGGYLICESIDSTENAKLISAAPDLLDACRQMRNALNSKNVTEFAYAVVTINKAIIKATSL